MHIVWLHETEPRGGEEALGFPGSAGEEEEAAAPGEAAVEVQEEVEVVEVDEDLRAASSAVGEGAEEGGADTCAPSPGEGAGTLQLFMATHGPVQTLRTRSGRENTYFLCVVVLCFCYHQLYLENKDHGYQSYTNLFIISNLR